MAVIPVGKGLWQEALGKALLSHARGSGTLSAVFDLSPEMAGLAGQPASRPSEMISAEEEPQRAAGQSRAPGSQCPGNACPLAAPPPAGETQRRSSLPGPQHQLPAHLLRFKDESRIPPSARP